MLETGVSESAQFRFLGETITKKNALGEVLKGPATQEHGFGPILNSIYVTNSKNTTDSGNATAITKSMDNLTTSLQTRSFWNEKGLIFEKRLAKVKEDMLKINLILNKFLVVRRMLLAQEGI